MSTGRVGWHVDVFVDLNISARQGIFTIRGCSQREGRLHAAIGLVPLISENTLCDRIARTVLARQEDLKPGAIFDASVDWLHPRVYALLANV